MKRLSVFFIILLVGNISYASEVCIIKYTPGGPTSISCNGADYQLVSNQLSGALQQKMDQKFDLKFVKPVGNELVYTLVKK